MNALTAAARYELRMQLRKPAIWIATVLPFAVFALFAALGSDSTGLSQYRYETSPKVWMVEALGWFTPLLPMVFGIVLADRLVRDRKLGVAPLLDVTPAGRGARLAGKYLGACAATAVPVALIYLGVALAFAVWRARPAALLWGLATFAAIVVPLLLLVGAMSFVGPLLMPTPLFRVLVVGVWFWAGSAEVDSQLPSLAGTVLSLTMDYPLKVFFGSDNASAGPAAGAALNVLRPPPTIGTALLSLALMLGIAAGMVAAARALTARTGD
jgi:ABC-type transport system involved in multi-copper enzyme maturation permease subunit